MNAPLPFKKFRSAVPQTDSCAEVDLWIEEYSAGALESVDTIALIESHVLSCEACQAKLDECDRHLSVMKAAMQAPAQDPSCQDHPIAAFVGSHCCQLALPFLLLFVICPLSGWAWAELRNQAQGNLESTTLVATRSTAGVQVRPATSIRLELDTNGMEAHAVYILELDSFDGTRLKSKVGVGTPDLQLSNGLPRGRYVIRIRHSISGPTMREFAFSVCGPAPSVPTPAAIQEMRTLSFTGFFRNFYQLTD